MHVQNFTLNVAITDLLERPAKSSHPRQVEYSFRRRSCSQVSCYLYYNHVIVHMPGTYLRAFNGPHRGGSGQKNYNKPLLLFCLSSLIVVSQYDDETMPSEDDTIHNLETASTRNLLGLQGAYATAFVLCAFWLQAVQLRLFISSEKKLNKSMGAANAGCVTRDDQTCVLPRGAFVASGGNSEHLSPSLYHARCQELSQM